jgi:hypothetical protein
VPGVAALSLCGMVPPVAAGDPVPPIAAKATGDEPISNAAATAKPAELIRIALLPLLLAADIEQTSRLPLGIATT